MLFSCKGVDIDAQVGGTKDRAKLGNPDMARVILGAAIQVVLGSAMALGKCEH